LSCPGISLQEGPVGMVLPIEKIGNGTSQVSARSLIRQYLPDRLSTLKKGISIFVAKSDVICRLVICRLEDV